LRWRDVEAELDIFERRLELWMERSSSRECDASLRKDSLDAKYYEGRLCGYTHSLEMFREMRRELRRKMERRAEKSKT